MSLSDVQHSLIVGSLLGDGAMRCKQNALLEVNHSAAQRTYVDWKYGLLQNLVATPPKLRHGNGGRQAYRFTTLSLAELRPYYEAFYSVSGKVIPKVKLTPLALAVWFMDDGCKSHRALYLNTQQFDVESQTRLLDMLWDQWGIAGSLNRDKSYYRIRIRVTSVPTFRTVIAKHLLPGFLYKIPLFLG